MDYIHEQDQQHSINGKTKSTDDDDLLDNETERDKYVCYIIQNPKGCTYVGITNNLKRRLRQHNEEIKGGARSTRGRGPWHLAILVENFKDQKQALSLERYLHNKRPNLGNRGRLQIRLKRLLLYLSQPKFSNLTHRIMKLAVF